MTDPFEQFTAAVSQAYRCIQRIKNLEMDGFGLRGTHVMCLYVLGRHPNGLTAAELSCVCGEDKAAISRAAGLLEQRGLIVFAPETDKKRYRAKARLTQAGTEVARQMTGIILHVIEAADRGISETELAAFYRTFTKLTANLQNYLAGKEA